MFLTVNDFVFLTSFFSNDALSCTSYEISRFHPPRYRGFRCTFSSKTVSTNFILLKLLVFFHTANIQFLHTNIQIFRGIFDKNRVFSQDTPLFLGCHCNFIKFQFEIISTLSRRFLYEYAAFGQHFTRNRPFYIQIVSKNSISITFRQKSAPPPKFSTPTRKNTQNIQTPLHFYPLYTKTSKNTQRHRFFCTPFTRKHAKKAGHLPVNLPEDVLPSTQTPVVYTEINMKYPTPLPKMFPDRPTATTPTPRLPGAHKSTAHYSHSP